MDPLELEKTTDELTEARDGLATALDELEAAWRTDAAVEEALRTVDNAHAKLKAARGRLRAAVMAPLVEWR